ncbi:hypothetical protein ACINNAV57_0946 [Acinetobacter baumannii Naval-57]|nr:hypothetical protein ACINNAV57_0946 [Acinetobacter baumannii Naval-57]
MHKKLVPRFRKVLHRIDDLEKKMLVQVEYHQVLHRIDDLEITKSDN